MNMISEFLDNQSKASKLLITADEYLDNEKRRGTIVYRCKKCNRRLIGAAVFYHERIEGHSCENEDRL